AQVIECIRTIINVDYPEQWPVFNKTIRIANPSTEVADLIKNICKIFWSSVYVEIPKQLCDPNIFNSWMVLFLTILGRTIHMEGQPSDPDDKKLQGWWKVKKWTIIIFTTLLKRILNNSIYRLLHPRLDIIIFEIIFPLMCFNDNDGKLWKEDPHEYVRKRYDSLQDLYSPRSAAVDLLLVLLTKCEKCCFQKFIHFIGETFRRYNEAPIDAKPYSLKCGALHAIGVLSSILKQMEPYKSQLECMLLTHVIPDFMSSVAHLRA
ncbi:Importin beta-like SAD2, partial [Ananas comosus]